MPASFPPARAVAEGARLAIIAPAGPFNREAFDSGVEWLRQRYQVSFDEGIYSKTGYFAGPDDRRLTELVHALSDPSIDAILCARGGYGATRLLPGLDPALVEQANKLMIGFSDVTALHSLWARAGVRSVHAPMVAALGGASEEIREKWIATVEGKIRPEGNIHPLTLISKPDNPVVSGRFTGGNLAVLGALNGTPYVPPLDDGCILFLEDVGERPYRIDRVLTTLKQSGWFEKLGGIALGSFTEGNPGDDGTSVEDVFMDHFGELKIPVLLGLSAGHIADNEPLVFGTEVTIDESTFLL